MLQLMGAVRALVVQATHPVLEQPLTRTALPRGVTISRSEFTQNCDYQVCAHSNNIVRGSAADNKPICIAYHCRGCTVHEQHESARANGVLIPRQKQVY